MLAVILVILLQTIATVVQTIIIVVITFISSDTHDFVANYRMTTILSLKTKYFQKFSEFSYGKQNFSNFLIFFLHGALLFGVYICFWYHLVFINWIELNLIQFSLIKVCVWHSSAFHYSSCFPATAGMLSLLSSSTLRTSSLTISLVEARYTFCNDTPPRPAVHVEQVFPVKNIADKSSTFYFDQNFVHLEFCPSNTS